MWTEWRVGDWIAGRWEVQTVLGGPGRSGMGIVYVVYDHDPEWRRHLAAKTFQQKAFARDPRVAYRFEQEALVWTRLDHHPNVTRAHLFVRFDNIPLLLLEYIAGGDLSTWIGSPMLTKNLPQVLQFAMQFCDGMSFLVSKGIKAHRDIKPQNCLISENSTLKITDLGIAKVFDDGDNKPISSDRRTATDRPALSPPLYEGTTLNEPNLFSQYEISSGDGLTRPGAGLGTACYMAPEQFRDAKNVDIRADVYSFGIMVFEMATGRLPFQGTTLRDLERLHCRCAPPQLTVDSRLNSIVQRCLEKNPIERFGGFEEIKTRLSEIHMALSRLHPSAPLPPELPTDSDLVLKAASMLSLGRNEDALDYSQGALTIQPTNIHAHCNKGTALMRLGRLEEAISSYDRALELNPRHANALIGKAEALKLAGPLEEALVVAERAVDIAPQNIHAFSVKGSIEDSLGMPEVALITVETALQLDANFVPALVQKGKLLSSLARIIRDFEDKRSLLCYKHVDKTQF